MILIAEPYKRLCCGELTSEQVENTIEELKNRVANRGGNLNELTREQTVDKSLLRVYNAALTKFKEKNRPRGQYIRVGIYTLDHVFNIMGQGSIIDEEGHKVNTDSARYVVFRDKGVHCVTCGIEGTYFAKEKDKLCVEEVYHYNLYAVKDGKEILMTKDHIKPKFHGGSNHISNLQPMCRDCNCAKGSQYEEEAQDCS